ncbi:MAG: hypothetical protein OXG05_03840 [Gammaproteobacteria bacterium]|nr:hypothetical protein [Gammaproteobacteria bacterium]
MSDNIATPEFWAWVASQEVTDTPRGDFIQDTKDILDAGNDPSVRIMSACAEAQREYQAMLDEYPKRAR